MLRGVRLEHVQEVYVVHLQQKRVAVKEAVSEMAVALIPHVFAGLDWVRCLAILPKWDLSEFEREEPIGALDYIEAFLEDMQKKIRKMLEKVPPPKKK